MGDEHGFVRLLDSAINAKTPFGTAVESIACHENAVFDISWSKDDSQIVRSLYQLCGNFANDAG